MSLFSRVLGFSESILTYAVSFLSKDGFDTRRYRFNAPEVWYSPWNEDAEFNALYELIRGSTLISRRKLFELYSTAPRFGGPADGLIVEIGTYRGGSSGLLASIFPDRSLVLWDIWNKTVEEDNAFVKKIYSIVGDLEHAQALLKKIGTSSALSASFVDDVFPNLGVISSWNREIALVHFDIYDSGAFKSGMEILWPRLAAGGAVFVGGYGAISLDPLTRAVNEFVTRDDCFFVQSQSGMGLIVKKGA